MKNVSIYIGFTLVSDNEDGSKRVSNHKGLDYHGMDDAQAVVVEGALLEFGEEYDALQRKIDAKMVEIGIAITGAEFPDKPNKPGKP